MTTAELKAEIAAMPRETLEAMALAASTERDQLRRQLMAYEVADEAWLEMLEHGGVH